MRSATVMRWPLVVLVSMAGCGSRVTTTTFPLQNCPRRDLACVSGSVVVDTELPPGTRLERSECDYVCAAVLCPSQEKTCTVMAAPLDGREVRCVPWPDPRCFSNQVPQSLDGGR